MVADRKQSTNAADSFERAAEIHPPKVAFKNRFGYVEFGNEIPAVIVEVPLIDSIPLPPVIVENLNLLLHSAPLPVVGKHNPRLLEEVVEIGAGLHGNQPVLGIPLVSPAAVLEQITVFVINKDLGIRRKKRFAGNLGDDLFVVRSGRIANAVDADTVLPQ